ncbi:MAG: glycosyltransferase family 4 protein [Clostridia bacterium]|nr:glycosyltransferase family 4 protein [Clostridia bacterium]
MKIAIVNTWAISNKAIGGTERFVIDLAKSFASDNYEVDVFMFSGKSYSEDNVNYININLFNMEGEADEYIVQNYFGNFETDESYINLAKKLEDRIDVTKYDFIQLNSLLFLEAWKNKKRIFTIHTNPFEYELAWGEKSYQKMLELMRKYQNDKSTIFVAPSEFYASEYTHLTGCNINFIPHAIDIKRIQTNKSVEDIVKQYDLSQNKLKIIVPSRLEPIQKQPMMLLEACSLLNKEEKEKIQIIYTGLDKQYEKFVDELKEKAQENDIDIKIIRFDEMGEVYKIGDMTVLPSKSESFGYSALESLSLGIFTILNDIPTFHEITQENDYCYIFKNNVIELKEKIEELIKSQNKLTRKIPKIEWQERYDLKQFESSYVNLIK